MNKSQQIPALQVITPNQSIRYYQQPTRMATTLQQTKTGQFQEEHPVDTLPHKKYNQYSNQLVTSKVIGREYSPSLSKKSPQAASKQKPSNNHPKSKAKSQKPDQSTIGKNKDNDESESEQDFDDKQYELEMKAKLAAIKPSNFQISPLAESLKQDRLLASTNMASSKKKKLPLLQEQSEQKLYVTSQNFALFFHGF